MMRWLGYLLVRSLKAQGQAAVDRQAVSTKIPIRGEPRDVAVAVRLFCRPKVPTRAKPFADLLLRQA